MERQPDRRGAGHQLDGEAEAKQIALAITLLPLPPYCPELNPTENVWKCRRENKLCALIWDTYDDIVEACIEAWRFLVDDPERIQSIGHRK